MVKREYVEDKEPKNYKVINEICRDVIDDRLFGFLQVNIHVPEDLKEKFSEFDPLFLVDEVPQKMVPEHMKRYQEDTGRKTIKGTKKLLGVRSASKILLYTPVLKWYLNHGLEVTGVYKDLKYTANRPFAWFT